MKAPVLLSLFAQPKMAFKRVPHLQSRKGHIQPNFQNRATSSGAATPWDAPRMFVTDIVHCDSDISIGCDTPLTIFQKILRVLSSVRHFFSVAHDTPLTLFQKILRVLSSVRHFFSVARDTFNRVIALPTKEGEDKSFSLGGWSQFQATRSV